MAQERRRASALAEFLHAPILNGEYLRQQAVVHWLMVRLTEELKKLSEMDREVKPNRPEMLSGGSDGPVSE